jgi:hypothetical protein
VTDTNLPLPVSKDVNGDLRLFDSELQERNDQKCQTLMTDHILTVDVVANKEDDRCDSRLADGLNGRLLVPPSSPRRSTTEKSRHPHRRLLLVRNRCERQGHPVGDDQRWHP